MGCAAGGLLLRRGIQLRQAEKLHLPGPDAAAALLFQPAGQMAGAVAEQAVAGEGAGVNRLAVEQVDAGAGGATSRQEGRHQQAGIEAGRGAARGGRRLAVASRGDRHALQGRRRQFLADRLHLQGRVAPQGGIAPAHDQPGADQPGPMEPVDEVEPIPIYKQSC